MDSNGRARIENDRSRLLTAVFLVLAAFAVLAATVSLLGPDFVEPLTRTPHAVRLGILGLALAFIGLVSERERSLRKAQDALSRQELVITAFQSRLEALDGLLDACNRVNSAVSVDGVLEVIAETGVALAGAQSGRVDCWDNAGSDVEVRTTSVRTNPRWDRKGSCYTLRLPLLATGRQLGELQLVLKEGEAKLDGFRYDAVTRFASEAGVALEKARLLAHEQATTAHLEAQAAVAPAPEQAPTAHLEAQAAIAPAPDAPSSTVTRPR